MTGRGRRAIVLTKGRTMYVVWRWLNIVHRTKLELRHMPEFNLEGRFYVTATGCCLNSGLPGDFHTLALSHTETRVLVEAQEALCNVARMMADAARQGTFRTQSDVVKWLSKGRLDI